MSPEEFVRNARAEQDQWINSVGRLILAAASIERSVNEILEVLSPEDIKIWQVEEFSKRVDRISKIAKENLSDDLAKSLKCHKQRYWPVMERRNAIAHNPLVIESLSAGDSIKLKASIRHQRKGETYDLGDVERFADEADDVSDKFMVFAINFANVLDYEIRLAHTLSGAMHLHYKD